MERVLKGDWTNYQKMLLSLSGGVDSTVLFFLLIKLRKEKGTEIGVFHMDHALREESSADYDFVENLCFHHKVPFYGYRKDVLKIAEERGESVEKTARDLRYEILEELADTKGYDVILLGHHRQDRVETFLMNLLRGSGVKGLLSIPEKRGRFYRPLWNISRSEIEEYAKTHRIDFVKDHTNEEDDYFRNKVRNHLIPLLREEYSPQIERQILQLSEILRREHSLLEKVIDSEFPLDRDVFDLQSLKEKGGDYISVFVSLLFQKKFPHGNVNYQQHLQLTGMIAGKDDGELTIQGVTFSLESGSLRIFTKKDQEKFYWELEEGINHVLEYTVQVETGKPYFDDDTISIPKDQVCGKLVLRTRKPGDVFQPVGFSGRKKIQDYFTDEKVPRSLRDEILILADDKMVYWIIGYRKAQIPVESKSEYYRVRVYKET